MEPIIKLNISNKTYQNGWGRFRKTTPVPALQGFSLTVERGESVAIVGESGIGKSTLLNILGLIDRKYDGDYSIMGKRASELTDTQLAQWRNARIGFVLQESSLINTLRVEENIKLPFLYADPRPQNLETRFARVVDQLGIRDLLKKKPLECSGGQKSRIAFARAIMMNPPIILADEPSSALDDESKERMLMLLRDLNENHGTTVITVTHDSYVASQHSRIITLHQEA